MNVLYRSTGKGTETRSRILETLRGRSPDRPLTPGLISQWAADLGFEKGQRGFTPAELEALRWVNRHYASGGTRQELLQKLKQLRKQAA